MSERTRLISYLLYGVFSAILKKNRIKNTGSNFQHPLARPVALFVAHTKEVSVYFLYIILYFLSVIEKIVTFCRYFLLFSPSRS